MKKLTFQARGTVLSVDELITTKNDKKVTRIYFVTNDGYYNEKDEWVETPTRVNIVFFGSKAESAQKRLYKGRQAVIDGTIKNSEYVSEGKTIHSLELVGTDIDTFGKAKGS